MTQSCPSSTPSTVTFSSLGLIPELVQRLTELKYSIPTPIQVQAIPAVLSNSSILGQAKTGSGKTAAFALPLLQMSMKGRRKSKDNNVSSLILVPTRELAQQVASSIQNYGRNLLPRLKIEAVYGGQSVNTQMLALRGGVDILVATPGRLLDLVSSNAIKLDQVKSLVLDEADRMLSLGFHDELAKIKSLLPEQKQILLFSATFPEEVKLLADHLLHKPIMINVEKQEEESLLVQRVITVNKDRKTGLLIELIKQNQWRQLLIFASAKYTCNRLEQKLSKAGIVAEVFHSDKGQGARNRILSNFKNGEIEVLIATDIAARGIDIEKLPVVINYELPRSPMDYMHRIGRSARAGESGLAVTLLSHDEYQHFKLIEKKNKLRLEREQIKGFEADDEAPLDCPSRQESVMAKPAGTGKKKRKNLPQANNDVWKKPSV
ncbi:DEAD/DEAH box helicase [Shewanella surugensis]|uniref:DEAD/DEAH box helicase n=1 Tax=Shewanella surugensis TaxID=212020 RepID=A0ABT0LJ52_9GAMM|nr:DEAD/DEAH box helicase [Shewanella surugensis]MCL1127742.1 DEAD/DEAH box helicase [Shewanella surugensis]